MRLAVSNGDIITLIRLRQLSEQGWKNLNARIIRLIALFPFAKKLCPSMKN